MHLFCKTQVEAGIINEDNEIGALGKRKFPEVQEYPYELENLCYELKEAKNPQLGGVHKYFDPGGAHLRASHAGNGNAIAQLPAQFIDKAGAIEVARGLASKNPDFRFLFAHLNFSP